MDVVDIKINLLPSAWIKKYFVAASFSWNLFEDIINGINLKRLISRPHHKNNQFLLEIIISELIIKVVNISMVNGRFISHIKDLMELNHQIKS